MFTAVGSRPTRGRGTIELRFTAYGPARHRLRGALAPGAGRLGAGKCAGRWWHDEADALRDHERPGVGSVVVEEVQGGEPQIVGGPTP
ncbi:hypothetical protein ATKI12_8485 [Kitasatospora sp. Ki12]